MRGKKRTGDRYHHNRSFQKPRSGQSKLLRGSYRPGHNPPGRGFGGGGRSPFLGWEEPRLSPADWRLHSCAAEHRKTCCERLPRHLLRLWQAWPKVIRLPRQQGRRYSRESTYSRRPTSSGCTTADCRPCEVEPPHRGGGC
jgi:hypothetical protein